jgi:hypothetical protein
LVTLTVAADSDGASDEWNEENNELEVLIDARPDLTVSATAWGVRPPASSSGVLSVTWGVTNLGPWPTLSISTSVSLHDVRGLPLLPSRRLATPALLPGDWVTTVTTFTLVPPAGDLYHLIAQVDSDTVQDESDEGNNTAQAIVRVVVTTTLQPAAATVLTSTSGHMVFVFPTGTVTAATDIRFTPLATSEVPVGPLHKVAAFRLAAFRDGQPVSLTLPLPVTATWWYSDADVAEGLGEDGLGLYLWAEDDRWRRVSSPAERRWPEENRLRTAIQALGEYAFGVPYKSYLPVMLR